MEEIIKEIYYCTPLAGDDALVKWHNNVIEKTVEDLTVADVARCIRQNLFVEKAYEALLSYLLSNPYAGDVFEGELMDKASEMNAAFINKHKTTINEIIEKAETFIKEYEWICEKDKKEYYDSVQKLRMKMNEKHISGELDVLNFDI